ncbi:MAG: hypothetical protein AAF791_01870 [Bacteroidota bacterium]
MTYDARPEAVGSWSFEIREADESGPLVARVELKGLSNDGVVRVGGIPFEMDRDEWGRAYRLLFEGQAVARAVPTGTLSTRYDLIIESALLVPTAPLGDRTRFTWAPTDFGGTSYELRAGEERVGRVEKTALLFRHYALTFSTEVPLALQAFCFGLMMARLRSQQS